MSPRQSQAASTEDTERTVRVVDNDWVELPDGVRLPSVGGFPRTTSSGRCRRSSTQSRIARATARRSRERGLGDVLAAHGFAFAWVDLRGSGDSGESAGGRVLPNRSSATPRQVIAGCRPPVVHGRRGMIGASWGGFAALQMAASRHSSACGVVPSTRATTATPTTSTTSAGACRRWTCPSGRPRCSPTSTSRPTRRWRRRSLAARRGWSGWNGARRSSSRGSATSAGTSTGSRGRRARTTPRSGARCSRSGGWSDGYRDMVLRFVEHVAGPVRGLIGPWGLPVPAAGRPGPAIGFLQECRAVLRGQPRRRKRTGSSTSRG